MGSKDEALASPVSIKRVSVHRFDGNVLIRIENFGVSEFPDSIIITEALEAYASTGLSPSQLLEQRAELLRTAKRCRDWLIDWHDAKETLLEIDAIISKCEGTS